MPRYYFDLLDGRLQKDETGQDLADVAGVCIEIRRALSEMILHGVGPASAVINVRGEDNQTVVTASISLSIDYPVTHH